MPSSRCFTIYKKLHFPILDDDKTVYDRWSLEQKCKQKSMGTAINMVGMEDIERPLPFIVDWNVALSKRNLSLF